MASSSSSFSRAKQGLYPPPMAKYEDVVASPKLFLRTLEKLHSTMGTKFMIPIIGGMDLDLHRLFVEVTSRGGIEKVVKEKRWKEVTCIFSFPPSATNASFILRKYYLSLLHHYEQIYFFNAEGAIPLNADALQSVSTVLSPPQGLAESSVLSCGIQPAASQPMKIHNTVDGEAPPPTAVSQVAGTIDGKFESGYLVTVTIGSERLKGVLYHVEENRLLSANACANPPEGSHVLRRRRRKKCEMKKRDPSHPKTNRSGYNFFFAEQHARLKPLHPRKDREISRMIGELWNKLKEPEKTVYQEKAMKDKERYRLEMEDYKMRLKTGRIISNAVPIQQQPPESDANTMEIDEKTEIRGEESSLSPENESVLGGDKTDEEDGSVWLKGLEKTGIEEREPVSSEERQLITNVKNEPTVSVP